MKVYIEIWDYGNYKNRNEKKKWNKITGKI